MKVPVPLLFAVLATAINAFGQGVLTPPGAPAPTMKTLDQVEARTPLAGGISAVTISADGSYYLTSNISLILGTAINITANNVTLDLNGFTVSASASNLANGSAVLYSGAGDLTVRNGHIVSSTTVNGSGAFTSAGFSNGISASGSANSVRVENVSITGVAGAGITVSTARSVISHCEVTVCGGTGISTLADGSVVDHCHAHACGSGGISASQVSACEADSSAGNGIVGQSISDCYGVTTSSGAYAGIYAISVSNSTGSATSAGDANGLTATTITNCEGYVAGNGTGCYISSTATGCYGYAAGVGMGLSAKTAENCYGVSSAGTGVAAANAINSCGYGEGTASGFGLTATTATNCYGYQTGTGTGLSSNVATGCYGYSTNGKGISAVTATTCQGNTAGTTTSCYGIDCTANGVAIGCQASAGSATAYSIRAKIANVCALGTGSTALITHNVNSF